MGKLLKFGVILLILGIVASIAGFLLSSDNPGTYFENEDYVKMEETIAVGEITNISVLVNNRKVIFGLSDSADIELVYYESENDPIDVTQTSDTLSVENEIVWYFNWFSGLQWFTRLNDVYYELYIYLPDTILYDIDVDALNGAIEINDLSAFGDLILETTNGGITLQDITCDTLRISTTNGDFTLSDLVADTMSVYTTNGRLTATNLTSTTGKMSLKTTNGIINATTLSTSELDCSTTNGNITVSMTGVFADYETDLSTTNGLIYVDDEVTDDGHYNTSQTDAIDISTTNGVIHLNFLG